MTDITREELETSCVAGIEILTGITEGDDDALLRLLEKQYKTTVCVINYLVATRLGLDVEETKGLYTKWAGDLRAINDEVAAANHKRKN